MAADDDIDDSNPTTDNITRSLEITWLARLSLIEYEAERNSAHERLDMRIAALDKAVMLERARIEKAAKDEAKDAAARKAREVGDYPPTEVSLATAFIDANGRRLRYNHTQQRWFVHDGCWRLNEASSVYRFVTRLPDDKKHFDTGKKRLIDAVERLARMDERVSTVQTDWDADPWLLGTPDGVVDLSTGEFLDDAAHHLISKCTAIAPSDDAECPLFDAFRPKLSPKSIPHSSDPGSCHTIPHALPLDS